VGLRSMTRRDLSFVAYLHRAALPIGLFPTLGPRFLRIYLSTYAASPFGLAYVALVDQRPVDFLVGCHDHRAHRTTSCATSGRDSCSPGRPP
jgi:hypothetical protein